MLTTTIQTNHDASVIHVHGGTRYSLDALLFAYDSADSGWDLVDAVRRGDLHDPTIDAAPRQR